MNTDVLFEKLPESLLQPPTHRWDGPQPGLHAQADEQRRYYFSPKTGRLETIVQYGEAGRPEFRVHYKANLNKGEAQLRAHEVQRWNGSDFISEGVVHQDGRVIRTHSLPRTMITEQGEEKVISTDEDGVYITPAGIVVKLEVAGTWFKRPQAVYLGRARHFNPAKPFWMKTNAGEQELAVDRRDVVVDPHGTVFEFTPSGLVAIGELVIPEIEDGELAENGFMEIPHEFFTLHFNPADASTHVEIRDPYIKDFLEGALPTVTGRHPFIHSTVPELADIHGSFVAEQRLRDVERASLELGLVFYALAQEQPRSLHAAFLKAQHVLEDRLWQAISELEKVVGMERHTLVSPAQIRNWIDRAAGHPHEALLELKQSARTHYAAR